MTVKTKTIPEGFIPNGYTVKVTYKDFHSWKDGGIVTCSYAIKVLPTEDGQWRMDSNWLGAVLPVHGADVSVPYRLTTYETLDEVRARLDQFVADCKVAAPKAKKQYHANQAAQAQLVLDREAWALEQAKRVEWISLAEVRETKPVAILDRLTDLAEYPEDPYRDFNVWTKYMVRKVPANSYRARGSKPVYDIKQSASIRVTLSLSDPDQYGNRNVFTLTDLIPVVRTFSRPFPTLKDEELNYD